MFWFLSPFCHWLKYVCTGTIPKSSNGFCTSFQCILSMLLLLCIALYYVLIVISCILWQINIYIYIYWNISSYCHSICIVSATPTAKMQQKSNKPVIHSKVFPISSDPNMHYKRLWRMCSRTASNERACTIPPGWYSQIHNGKNY